MTLPQAIPSNKSRDLGSGDLPHKADLADPPSSKEGALRQEIEESWLQENDRVPLESLHSREGAAGIDTFCTRTT